MTVNPAARDRLDATVVALLLIASAGAAIAMAHVNALGPFHRDGSHYLFMVLNLLDGQAPYWAQFETKNPGVELYWCAWHWLSGSSDVVRSARSAEAAYIAVSGAAIGAVVLRFAGEVTPSRSVGVAAAAAAALATTYLVSDWRVVDNGFNTAIYQTLAEATAIALAWSIATGRLPPRHAAFALGAVCFAAWMVKQSSLVSLAMPLVMAALRRRELVAGVVARAAAGFAVPLALFGVHLWLSETWELYKAGTLSYQGLRMSLFSPGYLERFERVLVTGSWSGIHSWLRWTSLITCLLAVAWAAMALRRWLPGASPAPAPLGLGMVILWAVGTLAQALIPGTFFHHYWLALIGPSCMAVALFGAWLLPHSRWSALAFLPALVFTGKGIVEYQSQADVLRRASATNPQAIRWTQLRPAVDMGSRVALWGGLPHPWVYSGQPSRYPNNMWWYYIRTGFARDRVDAEMRRKFAGAPPDYVIEIPEQYPPEQQLAGFPLSRDVLLSWTGRDYCVSLDLEPIPGRYGGRIVVWKPCASPLAGVDKLSRP